MPAFGTCIGLCAKLLDLPYMVGGDTTVLHQSININSLVPGRCGCIVYWICNFPSHFNGPQLNALAMELMQFCTTPAMFRFCVLLRNCPETYATGPYWRFVSIDSGNALVPSSTWSVPEPVLTCDHMTSLGINDLINWGLVTPYGVGDLGQHWFR